jgi:hypothetical protein
MFFITHTFVYVVIQEVNLHVPNIVRIFVVNRCDIRHWIVRNSLKVNTSVVLYVFTIIAFDARINMLQLL